MGYLVLRQSERVPFTCQTTHARLCRCLGSQTLRFTETLDRHSHAHRLSAVHCYAVATQDYGSIK